MLILKSPAFCLPPFQVTNFFSLKSPGVTHVSPCPECPPVRDPCSLCPSPPTCPAPPWLHGQCPSDSDKGWLPFPRFTSLVSAARTVMFIPSPKKASWMLALGKRWLAGQAFPGTLSRPPEQDPGAQSPQRAPGGRLPALHSDPAWFRRLHFCSQERTGSRGLRPTANF